MINNVTTEFYVPNQKEPIYIIEDSTGSYLALVYRTIRIKDTGYGQHRIFIDYELQLNVCKEFNKNERMMLDIYYHNLVSTLTRDIQTLFTDNIEERMNLPFYQNILHVKEYKK